MFIGLHILRASKSELVQHDKLIPALFDLYRRPVTSRPMKIENLSKYFVNKIEAQTCITCMQYFETAYIARWWSVFLQIREDVDLNPQGYDSSSRQ